MIPAATPDEVEHAIQILLDGNTETEVSLGLKLRARIKALEAELVAAKRNRCDDCGAKVTSYGPSMACPRCGAPNCCQPCCDKANALDRAEKAEAELAQAGDINADGYWGLQASRYKAERDAAIARVAVLVEALSWARRIIGAVLDGNPGLYDPRAWMADAATALANIPAAATALLAEPNSLREIVAREEQATNDLEQEAIDRR